MKLENMGPMKVRLRRISAPQDTEFEIEVNLCSIVSIPKVGQTTSGDNYVYVVESWYPSAAEDGNAEPENLGGGFVDDDGDEPEAA